MDARIEAVYKKLTDNLEEMTKLYRQLLDVVRKEKDFLIQVDVIEIDKCRSQKEELIQKVRMADMVREKYAQELGSLVGMESVRPRLLELAVNLPGAKGDTLRQHHGALEMVIKRLQGLNKENETYTQSVIRTLNGAIGNIKENLAGKSTYERKGQYKTGPEVAGNFIQKEA